MLPTVFDDQAQLGTDLRVFFERLNRTVRESTLMATAADGSSKRRKQEFIDFP